MKSTLWMCVVGSLLALLSLVVAGYACASEAAAPEPPPIQWFRNEGLARARSRALRKPMLIDFRAAWCAACTMLDRLTWTNPAVRAEVAARYVPLQLDLTAEDKEAAVLMQRYAVTALPTVIAGERRITGFVPAQQMLAVLQAPAE
jgi:thiol:disulfide interchange protein DsbD